MSLGPEAVMTDKTHAHTLSLRRTVLSLMTVVRWSRTPYCTEPANRENVSLLGKEQTPLYGKASCSNSPVCWLLTHIPSAPGFSGSFSFPIRWLEKKQGRLSLESCRVCDPVFSKKGKKRKKRKKIHKPPSSLFPAILHFTV